jgi:hypothetical protein
MGTYAACKALVIGVSRYADPQYDLGYARSDAEAMAELLGNEFGFDQVWTLYDSDATRQSIIRFFEQDLQRTDEDDGLLIFFAGHGITVASAIGDDRGFLVPHDGDPKQPYANLSLTTVRDDYLPMIPAKHVFLIVDACYGGLALRDVATVERSQSIDDAVLTELTRRDRKVRQVLAAGTKGQRVLDGGLFGHSVFTGRLIEALREANPYITADHVGAHVRERVAWDCKERHHDQTPQCGLLFGGTGSFVFRRQERPSRCENEGIDASASAVGGPQGQRCTSSGSPLVGSSKVGYGPGTEQSSPSKTPRAGGLGRGSSPRGTELLVKGSVILIAAGLAAVLLGTGVHAVLQAWEQWAWRDRAVRQFEDARRQCDFGRMLEVGRPFSHDGDFWAALSPRADSDAGFAVARSDSTYVDIGILVDDIKTGTAVTDSGLLAMRWVRSMGTDGNHRVIQKGLLSLMINATDMPDYEDSALEGKEITFWGRIEGGRL